MSKAEDRYIKLETKTLSDGRTVYRSSIPATVDVNDNDQFVIANERDRLDIIAYNAYGSALDWWRIAAANKNVNGSLHLTPGTKLVIPRK